MTQEECYKTFGPNWRVIFGIPFGRDHEFWRLGRKYRNAIYWRFSWRVFGLSVDGTQPDGHGRRMLICVLPFTEVRILNTWFDKIR